MPANNQTAKLSISSHVVVQLGAELVTDIEQALLELAKNAYDADSDHCEINIEPNWEIQPSDPAYDLLFSGRQGEDRLPEIVGRLCVRDYGYGLSQDAVDTGWLRISASMKRATDGQVKEKTKKHRVPVGDKGLGRLATMKIGSVLRLKTAQEREKNWRTVSFSWADFTVDKTLDDVTVIKADMEEVDVPGTIVEIIGLHDSARWNNSTFIERELIPNLSRLVSPFQSHDGFSITLKAGTRVYEMETLHDDVLNLASAKFQFEWDGNKLIQKAWISPSLFRGTLGAKDQERFDFAFNDINKPKLIEYFLSIPQAKERNATKEVSAPWMLTFSEEHSYEIFPSNKLFPGGINPGPFKAKFYYFLFNKATTDKLQQAGLSPAQMQAMSDVAIYRDGFKVRAQYDWLRLSEGSTSGRSFFGLRPANTLGFFALTNEFNHGLVEKSDREGFIDNHEFRGFMILSFRCKDYANDLIRTLRPAYNDFTNNLLSHPELAGRPKTVSERLEEFGKASAKNLAQAKSTLKKAINEIPASFANAEISQSLMSIEQMEKQLSEHEHLTEAAKIDHATGEENRLRLIEAAAVGLSARSLAHEFNLYVRQLREGVSMVNEYNKPVRDKKLTEAIRLLNSVTRELGKLVGAIDPLLPGSRSLKENLSLHEFLIQFVSSRELYAQNRQIELKLEVGPAQPDIVFRFSRTRFSQILENLFQNSVYWITHSPFKSASKGQILIEVTDSGFIWSDTGPGITPSIESSIFDPFISDKPSSEGQGLGLHVVSTFLEAERCSIHLSPDRNQWGRRYKFVVTVFGATFEHKQPKLFV